MYYTACAWHQAALLLLELLFFPVRHWHFGSGCGTNTRYVCCKFCIILCSALRVCDIHWNWDNSWIPKLHKRPVYYCQMHCEATSPTVTALTYSLWLGNWLCVHVFVLQNVLKLNVSLKKSYKTRCQRFDPRPVCPTNQKKLCGVWQRSPKVINYMHYSWWSKASAQII